MLEEIITTGKLCNAMYELCTYLQIRVKVSIVIMSQELLVFSFEANLSSSGL